MKIGHILKSFSPDIGGTITRVLNLIRNREYAKGLNEIFKDKKFDNALDLACGDGVLTEKLSFLFDKITLCDAYSEMINIAKKKINVENTFHNKLLNIPDSFEIFINDLYNFIDKNSLFIATLNKREFNHYEHKRSLYIQKKQVKMEKILLVNRSSRVLYVKIIKSLQNDYIVDEFSLEKLPRVKHYFFIGRLLLLKNLLKVINILVFDSSYKKIIICGGVLRYLYIIVWLFHKKREIILFRYDIDNFREYSNSIYSNLFLFINKLSEKYCMINSDKIIHKGLEKELEFLDFYKKIKNKPHYLFREFIDEKDIVKKEDMLPKLSDKDDEIHLVYVGGLYFKSFPGVESFWKFYPKITNQMLHLHIYSKVSKEIEDEFLRIEQNNRYFHYEGFRNHEDLIKELTQYDWGIQLFGDNNNDVMLMAKVAFSNKIYDYLQANLPCIVSNNQEAIGEFLNKSKKNILINYHDILILRSIILQKTKDNSDALKLKISSQNLIKFIGE